MSAAEASFQNELKPFDTSEPVRSAAAAMRRTSARSERWGSWNPLSGPAVSTGPWRSTAPAGVRTANCTGRCRPGKVPNETASSGPCPGTQAAMSPGIQPEGVGWAAKHPGHGRAARCVRPDPQAGSLDRLTQSRYRDGEEETGGGRGGGGTRTGECRQQRYLPEDATGGRKRSHQGAGTNRPDDTGRRVSETRF